MNHPGPAAEKIAAFLDVLKSAGGFRFDYAIAPNLPGSEGAGPVSESAGEAHTPVLAVELSGPDASLLLDRNGELLHAIESLGAAILRLTPEQNEQLSFDCEGFKQGRADAMEQAAADAVARVRSTGQPFTFPPMNSRERRMLHLALSGSGLPTASSGENPRRFVVLYPEGATPQPEAFAPPRPRTQDGGFGNARPGNLRGRNSRPGDPRTRDSRSPLSNQAASVRPGTEQPWRSSDSRGNGSPFVPPFDPAAGEEPDGNRADTREDAASAREREETIRRAFRKR